MGAHARTGVPIRTTIDIDQLLVSENARQTY
jgi:hypothetical protein